MYRLIKPFLFMMSPEKAHRVAMSSLRILLGIPFLRPIVRKAFMFDHPALRQEIWGLTFKNPVGLAAGFDKNAKLVDAFSFLGFGFIEIGTLTPQAQYGNPMPRLFRLPKDQALINRMGFNNQGVKEAVKRLKNCKSSILIGGNIGKNKATSNAHAIRDYLMCFHSLYAYVDYFVVNVSSPNTPGLRELQKKQPLKLLLTKLMEANGNTINAKPILLKIAPDLDKSQLDDILAITQELSLDGLIVCNTTIEHQGLRTTRRRLERIGAGGLSGAPLKKKSNEMLKYIRSRNPHVPIIAVGGIMKAEDAIEKIKAGANLVQVYTGLVYSGPHLVKRINKALVSHLN